MAFPPILCIGSFLQGFFLERYPTGDLAIRLRAAGWHVLVTSDKVHKIPRLCDMLFSVHRLRAAYSVAVVDVFSGPAFFWAESVCWLLRRLGKPFILTLHGGNLPAFARRWPGRVRRLLNSATAVTTPSRYLQQSLSAYRDDLQLLPNAIDLASYPFRLRSNPESKLIRLRALAGIYNPTMAVRALASLLDNGQQDNRTTDPGQRSVLNGPASAASPSAFCFPLSAFHLSIFGPDKGDGSYEKLKSEIRNQKLEGKVSLPGAVPKSEVPRVLSQGDIFLNTTNVDNTPVSVIEAMACGLCVVSTNVGGLPYLLADEQDSLLVQPDDPMAMAAAVTRILCEPGLAARLSRNARAKAEHFDWSVILPRWEQLLLEVAGKGSLTSDV